MPNGITSLPGFPGGLPSELTGQFTGFIPKYCGFNETTVIVIATYKGRVVPIRGATVTTFYSDVLARARRLVGSSAYETEITNELGIAQTCMVTTAFVEARIQKSDIDFGAGTGRQYSIGSVSGVTRGISPYVFFAEARTPPPPPPCSGSIDIPNAYEVASAFTTPPTGISPGGVPVLPTVPRLSVNAVVNNAAQSVPIAILVDGKQVATTQSSSGIDVLSIVRSLGPEALKNQHTLSIEVRLPNCNIPNPPPITIPAVPSLPACTPPSVYNPATGRCETICTPPGILNPVTGKCELQCTPPQIYSPAIGRCVSPCTPPQVYNPVTGRCETPCTPPNVLNPVTGVCEAPVVAAPTLPSPAGKSVSIETLANAYPTQKVPITVTVLCGAKPSNGEYATLNIDGKDIDEKLTSNGLVQFTWVAAAGTHRVIVDVPASDFCNRPGRDAVDINVSSQTPPILEQLTRERQAFERQQTALEQQRRLIRELPLPATVTIPTSPAAPSLTSVTIPPYSAPAGTTVKIGGQVIPAPTTAPVTIQVPPGQHTVVVQPPTGAPVSAPVQIPSSPIPVPITLPPLPALPGV